MSVPRSRQGPGARGAQGLSDRSTFLSFGDQLPRPSDLAAAARTQVSPLLHDTVTEAAPSWVFLHACVLTHISTRAHGAALPAHAWRTLAAAACSPVSTAPPPALSRLSSPVLPECPSDHSSLGNHQPLPVPSPLPPASFLFLNPCTQATQ